MDKYRTLLKATARMDTESVAETVGIDLTKPDFWRKSLSLYANLIERYKELL